MTTDEDEQSDAGLDDFDKASRLNFRDYPSTSLVMIAALSSAQGWGGWPTSGWAASALVSVLVLMMVTSWRTNLPRNCLLPSHSLLWLTSNSPRIADERYGLAG